MADEREETTPTGAPLEDESTTTQDLRAALSRARVDDLSPAGASSTENATVTASAALHDVSPETSSGGETVSENSVPPVTPEGPAGATAISASPEPVQPEVQSRPDVIEVPINHPMAALYMNTPEPPEFKGNRGIGVLIALLAGVAFAALFAGIIALILAPTLTPSQFSVIFVEYLLSLAFIIPAATFVVALIVLVIISNRAGWWAYVLGGFIVGVVVWIAATGGIALSPDISELTRREGLESLFVLALLPMPLLAGVAAREMTVWFGAWIGARGRKVTARNELALAEYEEALVESQNSAAAGANRANSGITISE